ncbi:pyridoxamine 5'-phosphate oxidase family protein [Streptomyces sp. AJS327]|uniref:pyridoxamine 5'-phosphate oxidase family protein n=1 Tax=Streptomyces sp. AJS327 TaxID=2545265 RepID=UPI0015DE49F8|nr:pyridoxamine 5'-phosphate oxidase family protein [Streptomyces sp. AJS327]MBA0052181.1 pyridoxamine 5'-phosphate oxidase family protein [Streptomyces sp. AJS327]
MTYTWAAVRAAEPTFADLVERRFRRFTHHVLGTLTADGSPRLTGLEADFREDELWLGMMPNSRKALDLRRDPRFALFANPGGDVEPESLDDVRVAGRAAEVTDPAEVARYAAGLREGAAPEVFHLFRAEVTEVTRVTIEVPDIVVESWRPEGGLRRRRRGNDASPPREDR